VVCIRYQLILQSPIDFLISAPLACWLVQLHLTWINGNLRFPKNEGESYFGKVKRLQLANFQTYMDI
jgi:hypothetical protein